MMNDLIQGFKADRAKTNIRMSVFVAALWIFWIIDMDDLQAIQPDDFVKLV